MGASRIVSSFTSSRSCLRAPREPPAPLEALDAAAAARGALLSRVGGMAVGADVHDNRAARRAGRELVAARGAADGRERQLRMYLFQLNLLLGLCGARSSGSRRSTLHPAAVIETRRAGRIFPFARRARDTGRTRTAVDARCRRVPRPSATVSGASERTRTPAVPDPDSGALPTELRRQVRAEGFEPSRAGF